MGQGDPGSAHQRGVSVTLRSRIVGRRTAKLTAPRLQGVTTGYPIWRSHVSFRQVRTFGPPGHRASQARHPMSESIRRGCDVRQSAKTERPRSNGGPSQRKTAADFSAAGDCLSAFPIAGHGLRGAPPRAGNPLRRVKTRFRLWHSATMRPSMKRARRNGLTAGMQPQPCR